MDKKEERIHWWNTPNNKQDFPLPIAVIKSASGYVATTTDDTKKILGERLNSVAQGKTKEEAIDHMFRNIRLLDSYTHECNLNYRRWVPLRLGPWSSKGGRWFTLFGMHFSFRHGAGMKGGRYIPFTKLNISFHSEWKSYKDYIDKKKKK